MRIGGISGAAIGATARRPAASRTEPRDTVVESRALIAIEAAAPVERSFVRTHHPAAPFLAHLIATRMQAPQTRERRRAEPEDAAAAYAAPATHPARRLTRVA
jgi:hypothetical protein